jgi:transcriptional regulator with XRE-family HTH domain
MAKDPSSVEMCHSQIGDGETVAYTNAVGLTLRIRELRKERGLTLAQLAGEVGISIPHMSQVERGVKNVNNHLLERIAGALRVQPYQLISAGGPTQTTLDTILDRLGPEDRQRVETFAQNLLLSKEPPHD